jgi:iron(III) transport system permease protein
LVAGTSLVLMETLADFGTVQHFGLRTFTTGIYEAWFGMADRGAASQLAAALLFCVALLMALEQASRGGRRFHPMTTRSAPFQPAPLHGWRAAAATLACGAPLLLGFVIPAGALLALMVEAGDSLAPRRFLPYLSNSLLLAAITASLAVLIAAWLAWAARLHPGRAARLANRVAGLGYAVPGSVIAVGTLVPFGFFDNALDQWMRARFGISTGCCCPARSRRWSSPISCASRAWRSARWRAASPASSPPSMLAARSLGARPARRRAASSCR